VTTRFGGQITLSQARQEANLPDSPVTPPLETFEEKAKEEVVVTEPEKEAIVEEEKKVETAPLATCGETELPPEAEPPLPNGHVEKPKVSGEGKLFSNLMPIFN